MGMNYRTNYIPPAQQAQWLIEVLPPLHSESPREEKPKRPSVIPITDVEPEEPTNG